MILPSSLILLISTFTRLPQFQEELVVKGVLLAKPEESDHIADLNWPLPLGDLDGDQRTDFSIGVKSRPPSSGRPIWDSCLLYGGLLAQPNWKVTAEQNLHFMDYSRIRLPLRTPNGWTILLDSGIRQSIELYDMNSWQQLGTVQLPPPPTPGVPAASHFHQLYPAGDVNRDGWDDCFWVSWTNYWTYSGLIDGATLTVAWQHYEIVNHVHPAIPSHAEPSLLPDLDEDATPDFLFIQGQWRGAQLGYLAVALSGRTGQEIWRREGLGSTFFGNSWVRDIDLDGTADMLLGLDADSVSVVAGRTGATIWSQKMDVFDPYFTSGYRSRFFWMSLLTRSTSNGQDEVMLIVQYTLPLSVEVRVFLLAADTGQITAVMNKPGTVLPWLDTPIYKDVFFPIGDVDRDGLAEFVVQAPSSAAAPPWYTGAETHYAILGQRTLFVPSTARIGSQVQAEVSIPSAGGMDCSLLLSTAFAPMGGWTVDRIETNLDPQDPVFQATNGRASLLTQLDVQGKGTILFTLPQASSLVGKDLYARALIRDPQTGKVWTVSNPSTIRITP